MAANVHYNSFFFAHSALSKIDEARKLKRAAKEINHNKEHKFKKKRLTTYSVLLKRGTAILHTHRLKKQKAMQNNEKKKKTIF